MSTNETETNANAKVVKYLAPDGKVYIKTGVSKDELPEFAMNENGALLYNYRAWQEVHDVTVNSAGNLVFDGLEVTINNDGEIDGHVKWVLLEDAGVSADIQKAINAIRSHNKRIRLKVTLLDDNYVETESLTGKIAGVPSYEMTSDSDIRRTCAITLSIPTKEQIDLDFENTWNHRMVELSCGIFSWEDNDYIWFKLGRMLMTSGSTAYDATKQEVKLNLVDLMACITEERGSQIGTTLLAQEGASVHDVLAAIIDDYAQFKLYNICEFEDTIPYDVKSNLGDYPIDYIRTIINLFPYYEYFYDVNGVFVTQQIPTKISDPIDFHKEFLDDLIISESRNLNFADIKNTTEIWGRQLHGDYVAMSCTTSGARYDVFIDDSFEELVAGETYTVMPTTTSVTGQTMKIQDTEEYAIYTADGAGTTFTPISAGAMKANVAYVIRYNDGKFVLDGELDIHCIVQEITSQPSAAVQAAYKEFCGCDNVKWVVNPDSPFACVIKNDMITGEMKQVLEGGEYDAIYTTSLAYERANYENWLRCRRQDTVDIEMILVPWMDINDKIEFTSPSRNEVGVWLVKGINYDFSKWTMTVKANKFYPYYPWTT